MLRRCLQVIDVYCIKRRNRNSKTNENEREVNVEKQNLNFTEKKLDQGAKEEEKKKEAKQMTKGPKNRGGRTDRATATRIQINA